MADRPPRILADGEVIDLGGKRIRYLDTPHIPHGWEAGVIYEETSRTLFCGDLFTQCGDDAALTESDIVGPAIEAENLFHASSLHPTMGGTIRKLGALSPKTLALMHGPSFTGDCAGAIGALAADYDARVVAAMKSAALLRAA
jgi:flavorubredoxin